LGGAIIFYSQGVAEMFGRMDWFERNLWSTRNWYILIGFAIIVVGFLIMFGMIPLSQPQVTAPVI
jgi:hypothetical protein